MTDDASPSRSTGRFGRPTGAGWLALIAAGFAFLTGWVFGAVELSVIGFGLVLLVGSALAWVSIIGARLDVVRAVPDHRVHAGDLVRVELRLTNRGRFSTPMLQVHEPASGLAGTTVVSPPVPPGASEKATYRVATQRRGLLRIGPTELVLSDPFGVAERRLPVAEAVDIMVRPTIVHLTVPMGATGDDSSAHPVRRLVPSPGQEFRSLREFRPGDELRRVHWAASARRDELLVHESEVLEERRTTVLLDVGTLATEAAFEAAVSAAASVLDAAHAAGGQVRLLTTGGFDSGSGPGRLDTAMGELALVQQDDVTTVAAVMERLGAERATLVVVTASFDAAALGTARARLDAGAGWLVVTDDAAEVPFGRRIVAAREGDLAGAWRTAMSQVRR